MTSAVNAERLCTDGSSQKMTACSGNIKRNTDRRPMKSDSHAHSKRPAPLAIEMIPTMRAASAALTLVISWAIGAACEMIAIPAVVLRNSSVHSPYHCQLRIASGSVYALAARCFRWAAAGVHPGGR